MPTKEIIEEFLRVVEAEKGLVAIHCKVYYHILSIIH